MEQPIYGDILFLINFSMDFLSLYLCACLLHLPVKTGKMALCAALGALYGVASLFFPLSAVGAPVLHLAVSALLCMLAFSPHRIGHFVKSVTLFYGIGFLLGGSMTAIYHLLNQYLYEDRIFYAGNYETLQENVSARMVLLLAAASAVLVFVLGRVFLRQSQTQTAMLSFAIEEREVTLTAMIDSGNLLSDSVTGTPVAFVQYEAVESALSFAWQSFLQHPTTQELTRLPYDMARRVRLVNADGISDVQTTLFCLRPDWVKVDGVPKKMLLAVITTQKRDFGSYAALLPALP